MEKVIDCVSFALNENLAAKPSKIVSGQEATKTNEFLQALAQVLERKIDTGPCVERVLKGDKPGKILAKSSNNKANPYNTKTAANNAKNKVNGGTPTNKSRDGSTSRKSSGESSSRETSRSRGNSKSPAKKVVSRQTSKEEPVKENAQQNGHDAGQGIVNIYYTILQAFIWAFSGLQTVIEGNAENGINHEIEPTQSQPLTNGNHHQEVGPADDDKPSTPKTPPAPAPTKEEPQSSRKTSSAASRSRSGSSRPTTGYGKNRTTDEQGILFMIRKIIFRMHFLCS